MQVYRTYRFLKKDMEYSLDQSKENRKYVLDVCSLKKLKDNYQTNMFKEVCSNVFSLSFSNKNIGLKGSLGNIIEFIKLVRLIVRNKYDIIHSHEIFASFNSRLAFIICKMLFYKKPAKIFITYHSPFNNLHPIIHFANRVLSLFTDKIICVSKSVMNYALQYENISADKLLLIYNGLNPSEFCRNKEMGEYQRKLLGYNIDDIVIGNIGVYAQRKGQIYLVKAFNELLKQNSKLKLVLVGTKRDYEMDAFNEMKSFVEKNNLVEYVKFLEPVEEVQLYYNIFDLFVMCSVSEGFGLVAYEAMLTEKICVFSDLETFKEHIQNNVNGFIYENRNVDSMVKVINHVLEIFSKLDLVRKNGRDYVVTNLSENEMMSKYINLYME